MFSDPVKNLEQFDISPGMKVADFGCGAGYYTSLAAQAAGQAGRVIAIDIQSELLVTLKRNSNNAHLFNVEIVQADFDKPLSTKLKDGSIERGILTNVLFQIGEKAVFLKEISRVMRLGGKVLVVDWSDSFAGIGPNAKDVVPAEECRKLFEVAGFSFDKNISAGQHHYGFVFKKV